MFERITNDAEYLRMAKRLRVLFDAYECGVEYDLSILRDCVDVLEEYESVRWPINEPTEEEIAEFRAEQMNTQI
jgi:hypothetical protein